MVQYMEHLFQLYLYYLPPVGLRLILSQDKKAR